jgi:arginyl-tRNA--protein-N-Asp/Glu arginylyltransferase
MKQDPPTGRLGFFLTPPHPCSYLAGLEARTVFADPDARPDRHAQTVLAAHGFRRSGRYVYRPTCASCSACVPVRIPVAAFRPDRSQRRTLVRNRDLTVRAAPTEYRREHLDLYDRYQAWRHPDGGMLALDPDRYLEFFTSPWSETSFHELRLGPTLVGLTITDRLDDGLSAVYTYYAPEQAGRSLGTFAVLWLIEEARRLGLAWVYLGYWIEQSPKMAYKAKFRPLEAFRDGRWLPL